MVTLPTLAEKERKTELVKTLVNRKYGYKLHSSMILIAGAEL